MSKTDVTDAKDEKKAESKKVFYFKSPVHAGLTVQVQKLVKNPQTGKDEQEIAEQASFVQYYDTWKGDTIRVGYLSTTSEKIADVCNSDGNVVAITEKEYKMAVEGDKDTKPLERAPVPAV